MSAAAITCPECKKTFKGRLEFDGKRVRCPACNRPFMVRLGQTLHFDDAGGEEGIKAVPAKKPSAAGAAMPPPVPKAAAAVPPPPPPAAVPATAITAPPPPPRPAFAGDEDDDDNPNPYGVTTPDLRPRCPSCANPLESESDVICLYCGYNTQTRAGGATRKVIETTVETHFMWLMPGLLCVLGIVVLVILCLIYTVTMPAAMGDSFLVHESLRMWVVIIALAIMWGMGQFAFNRLVMNPTPPEEAND
jgi:hypothetical protein